MCMCLLFIKVLNRRKNLPNLIQNLLQFLITLTSLLLDDPYFVLSSIVLNSLPFLLNWITRPVLCVRK